MTTIEELTTEEQIEDLTKWIDELHTVVLSKNEFNLLLEYSTTLPTGTTIGKQWKRQIYFGKHRGTYVRGEYCEDPEAPSTHVGIAWRKIKVEE